MAQARVDLPESDISIARAVAHLEMASRAVHEDICQEVNSDRPAARLEAYVQFRADAFLLLGHYVEQGLQDAFRWLLLMNDAAPQKARITIHDNAFHWGLLAMTSAARSASASARRWKPFMSPNKLRDLGSSMKLAHANGVAAGGLEEFIVNQRKRQHHEAFTRTLDAIRIGRHRSELVQTSRSPRDRARSRLRRGR